MRKKIFAVAGVAVLIIGVMAFAIGQGHQGMGERRGGGDMVEHLSQALNLTDAQKEQVKAIMDAERTAGEARHAKLHEIQKQIEAATANGQFDETVIRGLANQEAQLMADQKVEHIRVHSKIYALLTAEQRTKAEQMHKRGGPHGRRHGPPPGAPGSE